MIRLSVEHMRVVPLDGLERLASSMGVRPQPFPRETVFERRNALIRAIVMGEERLARGLPAAEPKPAGRRSPLREYYASKRAGRA